ncbi:hypothetical protein PSTT_00987 [Puccinia striiformis]|uniref:BED-type domain-containing protein n=1 Tax=Puccinia striiformis TaxID=27350 RepID=A0A2S4W5D3_9BASI|nr:hypothetical protein PSTT_00987 [Puccinia striiformis]
MGTGMPLVILATRAQSTESDPIDPDIVVMDDDRSTAPRTSCSNSGRELTDAEELFRAQRIASNAVSAVYAHYGVPELSTQKDKKGRYMIVYPCNMCNKRMYRPPYDSSGSNLLKHLLGCLIKQQDTTGNQSLASLGVNQLCALWCAEAANPFSALANELHRKLLHPNILQNLSSAKVVSRSIHMIYTAFQDSYQEVLKEQCTLAPMGGSHQLSESESDSNPGTGSDSGFRIGTSAGCGSVSEGFHADLSRVGGGIGLFEEIGCGSIIGWKLWSISRTLTDTFGDAKRVADDEEEDVELC